MSPEQQQQNNSDNDNDFDKQVMSVYKFSMVIKFRECKQSLSIAALKFFKGNPSTNFDFIAVFVKVALQIAKSA